MSRRYPGITAPALSLALWFTAGSLSARLMPVPPQPAALIPSAALWGLTILQPGRVALASSFFACGIFTGRLPETRFLPPWPETLEGTFQGEVRAIEQGPYGDWLADVSLQSAAGMAGVGGFPARIVFAGRGHPVVGELVRFRSFLTRTVRRTDGSSLYFGKAPEGGWVSLEKRWGGLSPRTVRRVLGAAAADGSPEASVFRALAMGDRSRMSWQLKRAFRRTGTVHLLAISGLHLACAVAVGFIVSLPLCVLVCGRGRPRTTVLIKTSAGLGSALMYLSVAGLSPSAGRAFAWAFFFGAAVIAGRHCEPLQGAGLCLLLAGSVSMSPQPDLSLGLSLLAFIGVVRSCHREEGALGRILRMSIGAFLYTCPLVVAVFGGLPLFSPFFNILVGVPFTVLLIPMALAAGWLSLICPGAAPALVGIWKASAAPVLALQEWGARLPWVYLALNRAGAVSAAITAAAAIPIWERSGRDIRRGLTLLAAIALAGILGSQLPQTARTNRLMMLFPNVGQADCAVIVAEGKVILVDSGPPGTLQKEPPVLRFLDREGIERVDMLVLTHLHPDHAGALPALLDAKTVEEVVMPRTQGEEIRQLFRGIEKAACPRLRMVEEGDRFRAGGVEFTVRHPSASEAEPSGNEGSLVLEMSWRGVTALFTGDAPWEAVALAVEQAGRLDLFKVPHHGSATGFDPAAWAPVLSRLAADGALVVCPSPPDCGPLPSLSVREAFFRSGLAMRFSGSGTGLRLFSPPMGIDIINPEARFDHRF